jgi:ferric-dicitrate binding protein FerR (iron transport regulator)
MKRIEYTKIKDFLDDTSFFNWVFKKSLSDIDFWNEWINKNPENKELADDAKALLLGVQFKKKTIHSEKLDAEWKKFESNIKTKNQTSIKIINILSNRKIAVVAATITLLIVSSLYFINKSTTIVHKAAFGEVLNIKLPDGTDVTLNSNSSLRFKEASPRKVKLKGEAFFKVVKQPSTKSKFWVSTNDLEVEVYGTEFNVNSHNKKTQVFLQEGSIHLMLKNGSKKKMIPGDLISYSFTSNSILAEKRPIRPELEISWKDGSLIFDRSSLKTAMHKIEETYGLTTIFEDIAIENILLTGAVPTKNIDICIQTIEKSAQVSIIKKNNKLYISKK